MAGDTASPVGENRKAKGRSPITGAPVPPAPGKKGRSGRPTNGWLDFTAALRGDVAVQRAIRMAASDPDSRGFKAAVDLLAKYDPELPGRKIQLDANLTVRGVIALPVMQVPQPGPGDRVIEDAGATGTEIHAPAAANPHPVHSARASLLARLTGPR